MSFLSKIEADTLKVVDTKAALECVNYVLEHEEEDFLDYAAHEGVESAEDDAWRTLPHIYVQALMAVGLKPSFPDDEVNADFEEEEHDQPDRDDAFLAPSGSLGSKTSLTIENKFIGEFSEDEDAQKAIVRWINNNNIYPNIWWVSDHGNVSKYTLDEKFQKMIKM